MVVHVSFRSLLLFLAALPTSGFIPKLYCNEPRTISWRTKLDHGRKYSTVVQRDTKRTDDTLEQFAKSEAERTDDAREESALRQKLVTESIAPWRALRLFFYGALGSGAAVGGFITLSGVAAALSGVRPDLDLNAEVG